MPSTKSFGLDFNQTKVRSAGAHTNTSTQQPANSGSGGVGPTGPAGGDLSGSYPNPTVHEIPPSSPSARINWLARFFVEDYATVQLAFTAACNAGGILFLPPGAIANAGSPLVWPTNFSGSVTIQGCGEGVSNLAGSIQLVSTGTPTVNLVDFSLPSGGIVIDLTGSGYSGGQYAGCVKNVNALGTISYAASTHAFYFLNFGQGVLENLNGHGPGNTSGNGLTINNCSNLMAANINLQSYAKGLNLSGTVAGQKFVNFTAVDCGYCIYSVLGTGAFQMTNWMADNGNGASSNLSTPTVYLQSTGGGPNPIIMSNGTVLQTNGSAPLYGVQLVGITGCRFKDCDFTYCLASDSDVYISSSSTFNAVSGCRQGSTGVLVHIDGTSTSNMVAANGVGTTFTNAGGGTNSCVTP